MLVELRDVEVEIEPEEILSQALRDGDLSVRDTLSLCQDEVGMQDMLEELEPDGDDIQTYCNTKDIELECDFEAIVKSLKDLSKEQRASLLWFIIGINDSEIKHLVTMELVIPKLNELVGIYRNINPVWDFMDDYYFCVIDDTEVNIRGYSDKGEKSFHLWMYNNKKDDEVVDTMYSSYSELQEEMMRVVKGNITFPAVESLLKITRGVRQ